MLRTIRLYLFRQMLNMRGSFEYKVDFIVANLASILGQVVGIAFVWVIFENIGDLGGWTLPQIMLIYGMAALPYGLFEILFNGLWIVLHHVREGSFDEFLVRPRGPLFWVLSDETALHGFGNVVTGLLIIALASQSLSFDWTVGRILFLLFTTACGVVIYTSVNLITASLAFWIVGTGSSIMFMVQRIRDFASYPVTIYSAWLRILLLWIVPFGFAGFVPAAALLEVPRLASLAPMIVVVSIALLIVALAIWRIGVNRYTSTGS